MFRFAVTGQICWIDWKKPHAWIHCYRLYNWID